jgi:hypothetical protein
MESFDAFDIHLLEEEEVFLRLGTSPVQFLQI